jgi:hypothetical protein
MSEFTTLEAPTNSQIPTLLATPVQKKKKNKKKKKKKKKFTCQVATRLFQD